MLPDDHQRVRPNATDMPGPIGPHLEPDRRRRTRRAADQRLNECADKYSLLIQAGQAITSELNVDALFRVISDQISAMLRVEKCSIFLIDDADRHLCSFVSPDLAPNQIQFPKSQGIAGWVYCHQTPQVVNDAYSDPRFNQWVDRQTGSRTLNLLCVPLTSPQKQCIGTMQVLNKKDGDFTREDVDVLTYMASYVAIALENSFLVEELKATDRARRKAVHHLSHELKTPLSILAAVLARCAHVAHDHDLLHMDKTLQRGMRSIHRLADIQEKVEDIIGRKIADCERQYVTLLHNLIDLIEEAGEAPSLNCAALSGHVIGRIRSILTMDEKKIETIRLDLFLKTAIDRARERMAHRHLDLIAEVDDALIVKMNAVVLQKICDGLLKNAVENTPDGGRIVARTERSDDHIVITVRDHGVGITEEDRKHIFQGFFHTQATRDYASKTPYAFNAGGAGMDLLRMRTFAERLGFDMAFTSQRCRFIDGTTERCPGEISRCPHVRTAADCVASGGSTFTVQFPVMGMAARGSAPAGKRRDRAGDHDPI